MQSVTFYVMRVMHGSHAPLLKSAFHAALHAKIH